MRRFWPLGGASPGVSGVPRDAVAWGPEITQITTAHIARASQLASKVSSRAEPALQSAVASFSVRPLSVPVEHPRVAGIAIGRATQPGSTAAGPNHTPPAPTGPAPRVQVAQLELRLCTTSTRARTHARTHACGRGHAAGAQSRRRTSTLACAAPQTDTLQAPPHAAVIARAGPRHRAPPARLRACPRACAPRHLTALALQILELGLQARRIGGRVPTRVERRHVGK